MALRIFRESLGRSEGRHRAAINRAQRGVALDRKSLGYSVAAANVRSLEASLHFSRMLPDFVFLVPTRRAPALIHLGLSFFVYVLGEGVAGAGLSLSAVKVRGRCYKRHSARSGAIARSHKDSYYLAFIYCVEASSVQNIPPQSSRREKKGCCANPPPLGSYSAIFNCLRVSLG